MKLEDVSYITNKIDSSMKGSRVKPQDVLLNITGASIGRCFYAPMDLQEANVNQHVCIIRCKHVINHLFLHQVMVSNVGQQQIYDACFTGVSREGLAMKDLKEFQIPLPPLAEQEAIVAKIQAKHKQIDAVMERIQKEIDLMNEYKTALISEAVTGKICVL